jgi:hypothetical protein
MPAAETAGVGGGVNLTSAFCLRNCRTRRSDKELHRSANLKSLHLTNMSAALSVAASSRPSTPQPESCICTLTWHLTNYKPIFMQQIIAQRTAHPGVLFYFDPDITVRAPWSFFVEWAQNGIAVCEDVNSPMPASHPRRLKWRKLFPDLEFDDRIAPCYVNGGFVGLAYEWRRFLVLWAEIISRAGEYTGGPDKWYALKPHRPEQPFSAFDQDALNVALMTSSMPFSIIGQDGMDFGPIGYLMSHAIGPRKPWHGGFALNALKGVRPSIADRQYMHNIDGPLFALSLAQRALSRGDLAIGKLLGRLLA